jgi:uncharacterized delta-60 repeat protein
MKLRKRMGFKFVCIAMALILGQCLTVGQEVSEAGAAQQAEFQAFLPMLTRTLGYRESSGVLDPSFGAGGFVYTDFVYDVAVDLVVQADTKIVVIGSLCCIADMDFAMARYLRDGSLDTGFGIGGKVVTDILYSDIGNAITLQPDGKIIAAGGAYAGDGALAMVRYNPDGSLDTSFDIDGKVTTELNGSWEEGYAVVLLPDGRIVVVGGINYGNGDPEYNDFVVARYNPDGSLDTGFYNNGWLTTDVLGDDDKAHDVAIQEDGKIVVVGHAVDDEDEYKSYIAVVRYDIDGSLDGSFAEHGKLIIDNLTSESGDAVVLQKDGQILVAGGEGVYPSGDLVVLRLNQDGTPDVSFGSSGRATVDFGCEEYAQDMVLQPDGKIIIAGYTDCGGGSLYILVRLNPDGSPDLTFGYQGKVMTDVKGTDEKALAVTLQPDGRIVITGSNDGDFVLVRYK